MKLGFYCTLLLCSCMTVVTASTVHAQDDTKNDTTKAVLGLDHLGLTVLDLEASAKFFTEVIGFEVRGTDAEYPAKFLSNGEMTLTLWQTNDPTKAVHFDRKNNVGLHHLALRVSSFEELDRLHEVISHWDGARIEFAPELAYGGPAKHMMIREPSGNRIELVHRPSQ